MQNFYITLHIHFPFKGILSLFKAKVKLPKIMKFGAYVGSESCKTYTNGVLIRVDYKPQTWVNQDFEKVQVQPRT